MNYIGGRIMILDLSHHNDVVDFAQLKDDGIEGVILRASYGKTGSDRKFIRNINECIKYDIPVGFYHFIYGITPEEMTQNANNFIETITEYLDKCRFTLGLWSDFEYDSDIHYKKRVGRNLTRRQRTDLLLSFHARVEELTGIKCGAYMNEDYSRNKFMTLYDTPIWYARYNSTMRNVKLIQYTSKGKVSGIDGDVDQNHIVK